jgi:hypothetical protein
LVQDENQFVALLISLGWQRFEMFAYGFVPSGMVGQAFVLPPRWILLKSWSN